MGKTGRTTAALLGYTQSVKVATGYIPEVAIKQVSTVEG